MYNNVFLSLFFKEFTDNEFVKWHKAIRDAGKKAPTMDFVRGKISEVKEALMYEFKVSLHSETYKPLTYLLYSKTVCKTHRCITNLIPIQ